VSLSNTFRRYLVPGAGFLAAVIVIVLIHESLEDIEYPLQVWRMDMDDLVANVGILAAAAAGVWKVKLDADKAHREADKANAKTADLERKFNGGLQEAAKTHMQDNEMFESLMVRVDRLEEEKQQEQKGRVDCEEALSDLRQWVITRLDQTGNGRSNGRTN